MSGEIQVLGKGNLYAFYRPKVEENNPTGPQDIQRFFLVLQLGDAHFSLLALGKKRMPVESSHRLEYAFVENVADSKETLHTYLEKKTYDTATQGKRHLPAARAVAEGKFILFQHRNVAQFAYELQMQKKGPSQDDFDLLPKANYVISIKNPHHEGNKGLPKEERANYPEKLQRAFGDYKFTPLRDLEYLRYKGAEILLIDDKSGDEEFMTDEIKKALDSFPHKKIEKELKLDRANVSKDPLKTGQWQ